MRNERKVGFIENTAIRHRRGGGREVTVTSRRYRQKDKERQGKTKENVDGRPVGAPRAGVRWRGSSTCAPGSGPRIAFAKLMMIISFPVFFREDKKKKKNWIVSRTGGSSVTSERAQEVLAAHDGRA